jgi:hypothetical protein
VSVVLSCYRSAPPSVLALEATDSCCSWKSDRPFLDSCKPGLNVGHLLIFLVQLFVGDSRRWEGLGVGLRLGGCGFFLFLQVREFFVDSCNLYLVGGQLLLLFVQLPFSDCRHVEDLNLGFELGVAGLLLVVGQLQQIELVLLSRQLRF